MKAAHSSPPDYNIKQSIYFRRVGTLRENDGILILT